jgi:hypothetical protein
MKKYRDYGILGQPAVAGTGQDGVSLLAALSGLGCAEELRLGQGAARRRRRCRLRQSFADRTGCVRHSAERYAAPDPRAGPGHEKALAAGGGGGGPGGALTGRQPLPRIRHPRHPGDRRGAQPRNCCADGPGGGGVCGEGGDGGGGGGKQEPYHLVILLHSN